MTAKKDQQSEANPQPETAAPDGPVDDVTVPLEGPPDTTMDGRPDPDPVMTGEAARDDSPDTA